MKYRSNYKMKYLTLLIALQVLLPPLFVAAASSSTSGIKPDIHCTSNGYFEDGICKCDLSYTGNRCEECLPGHTGPLCESCDKKCNPSGAENAHFQCVDNITGSGQCFCERGYKGDHCNECTVGYVKEEKNNKFTCVEKKRCGYGFLTEGGSCECNAGWKATRKGTNMECTTCADGYTPSLYGECLQCPVGCTHCKENSLGKTTCLECKKGFELTSTGSCVQSRCYYAINPLYHDVNPLYHDGKSCRQCHKNCSSCNGPGNDNCVSCRKPRFYLDGKCVKSKKDQMCPLPKSDHRAFVANAETRTCEPCSKHSTSCVLVNGKQRSKSCMPGLVLSDGKCTTLCDDGEYLDRNDGFTCKKCDDKCAACTGEARGQCQACAPIKNSNELMTNSPLSINGECSMEHNTCPKGYYPSLWSGNGTYFTANVPISLIDKLFEDDAWHHTEGVSESDLDLFKDAEGNRLDPNLCQPCHPDCDECDGNLAYECTKCRSDFALILKKGRGGQCVLKIPRGAPVASKAKLEIHMTAGKKSDKEGDKESDKKADEANETAEKEREEREKRKSANKGEAAEQIEKETPPAILTATTTSKSDKKASKANEIAEKETRERKEQAKQETANKDEAAEQIETKTPPPILTATTDEISSNPSDLLPAWATVSITLSCVLVVLVVAFFIFRRYKFVARRSRQIRWMVSWMAMAEEIDEDAGYKKRPMGKTNDWHRCPSEISTVRAMSTESERCYGPLHSRLETASVDSTVPLVGVDLYDGHLRTPEQIADPRSQRARNPFRSAMSHLNVSTRNGRDLFK